MVVIFFDWQGVKLSIQCTTRCNGKAPEQNLTCWTWHVWICWLVPSARQRPVPQRDTRQAVFGPTKSDCAVTVLAHPPCLPDLTPADYVLFPKVKSHLERRLFDSISDIQKAVTSTLNTIAKDDFYKAIQKLYDHAILCVQLEGMCVEI